MRTGEGAFSSSNLQLFNDLSAVRDYLSALRYFAISRWPRIWRIEIIHNSLNLEEMAMQDARVTGLAIYPVKSLRGIALEHLPIGALGPQGDRRFVVISNDGRFLTQRQFPRMCLVAVEQHSETLRLTAPEQPELLLDPTTAATERTSIVVWRDTIAACDMGDTAAAWFSAYLGSAARLYFMPEDSVRAVDPTYARAGDRVGFADGFPLLLTTQASLDDLNLALPSAIGMERFRPNVVISGTSAYAEDEWRRVRIGSIEFEVVKPCSRCVIPSIDPQTAEKQALVAQTLARLRRRDNAVYFGQNLIQRGEGSIAVGDRVTVLE